MPASGQEQQSRGLPTAHILPRLLRLLQQETQPLTPWQDPDSCPHSTLPALWGQAYPCSSHPQLLTMAAAARDPGQALVSVACPTASCKHPHGLPPTHHSAPLLGQPLCSCCRTMHCSSLSVFAWPVLFLIQVWALLPLPKEGPQGSFQSLTSHRPAVQLSQVLVLLEWPCSWPCLLSHHLPSMLDCQFHTLRAIF